MATPAHPGPPRGLLRTPLARGLYLSLSLHLALLAFVQVQPQPLREGMPAAVLDVRLMAAAASQRPVPEAPRPAGPPSGAAQAGFGRPGDPAPPLPGAMPASAPSDGPQPTVSGGAAPASEPSPEEGAHMPELADTRWYGAREVDLHPKALQRFKPPYPEEARRRGQEGSVRLRIRIDESGRVREAEVVQGHPPGVFDAVALEAIRKVGFEPARKAGKPVRYDGEFCCYRFELD